MAKNVPNMIIFVNTLAEQMAVQKDMAKNVSNIIISVNTLAVSGLVQQKEALELKMFDLEMTKMGTQG